MYYQVLLEAKNLKATKETYKLYELDKETQESVISEVILPYLRKESFQFNGYFLEPENIVRIVVKTTEKSVRVLSKFENDNMKTGLIYYVSPESIVSNDKYTTDITKELFVEAKAYLATEDTNKATTSQTIELDRSKVFIVHGHDELAKLSVARFLEKLDLEPIILHEQASSGNTIIEKIEEHSNVGFGIVLYTPCDLGASKGNPNLNPRARQNVVFEHGYLIAKIGRENVCALVKDEVETPNDISGIVYITLDSNGGWHIDLAKELKNSGYEIDMNRLF